MAKLIHLVVENCGECPYNWESSGAVEYCRAIRDDDKNTIDNWKETLKDCPLQTY